MKETVGLRATVMMVYTRNGENVANDMNWSLCAMFVKGFWGEMWSLRQTQNHTAASLSCLVVLLKAQQNEMPEIAGCKVHIAGKQLQEAHSNIDNLEIWLEMGRLHTKELMQGCFRLTVALSIIFQEWWLLALSVKTTTHRIYIFCSDWEAEMTHCVINIRHWVPCNTHKSIKCVFIRHWK